MWFVTAAPITVVDVPWCDSIIGWGIWRCAMQRAKPEEELMGSHPTTKFTRRRKPERRSEARRRAIAVADHAQSNRRRRGECGQQRIGTRRQFAYHLRPRRLAGSGC